ncbi:MAG: carbon storage regulator CsrA [Acidimicrobiales bacterium]
MLVLSRRETQSIVIGNDIVVTVVSVRGDQVRIGIDAPRSVAVHRLEVAQAIEAANRGALAPAGFDPASLPKPTPRPSKDAPSSSAPSSTAGVGQPD